MINKIKILRAEKGITQEELAEAVNVTRQTIIAIEKNKYVPSWSLPLELQDTLIRDRRGLSIEKLYICMYESNY